MLTDKEINAIRFYEGDIRKRGENGQILENEKEQGFYGTPSAYRTINCLMFEGTCNEEERIKEKSGKLVPELFGEIDKVIEVYCDILRAMCKMGSETADGKKKLVYRTERGVSVEELKKGYTVSFTSTSKEDKPEDFLKKKTGLTLLNFVIPPGIPYLDFQKVLGKEYQFEDQKEILLPPFLEIELEELELTEAEKEYRDADNQPPQAKYLVLVKGVREQNPQAETKIRKPLTAERNQKSAELLGKMVKKEPLTQDEKEEYCLWKKDVRAVIWNEFQKIRNQYFGKEELTRKELLQTDVRRTLQEFNGKRKEYKRKIRTYNIALIVTNTIPLACMALSFVGSIQMVMKIAAVITSTVSIFLFQMLRVQIYDIKLLQRSKTYLSLCGLNREIKYECMWTKEKEEEYIKKFSDIMKEDTEMSLHNLEVQAKNAEKLQQNDIWQES